MAPWISTNTGRDIGQPQPLRSRRGELLARAAEVRAGRGPWEISLNFVVAVAVMIVRRISPVDNELDISGVFSDRDDAISPLQQTGLVAQHGAVCAGCEVAEPARDVSAKGAG